MKNVIRGAVGAGLAAAVSAWVAPVAAGASTISTDHRTDGAVFVQTDNPAGNQVVVYDRAADGTLTWAGTYSTGGAGGVLSGSVVDHLASQSSLALDRADSLLFAVNAGSDSVSVFSASGDHLALQQVVGSGGSFPVSIAVQDQLVYVLDAKDASVSGFRLAAGRLHPIEGSTRNLGLTVPTDTTQFTHTPGQVAFSPDGSQVIVTTKANGNAIDVFGVGSDGRLSATPVVNQEVGTVPFAEVFDTEGHLVVANAGSNSLSTYALNPDGTVTSIDTVATGQAATCWVVSADGLFYTSNAGSGTLSGAQESASGQLTLLGTTQTDPGTVDAAATEDGRYLYVQTGASGVVDEFQVANDGTLAPIGSVQVPGAAGGEGIAVS